MACLVGVSSIAVAQTKTAGQTNTTVQTRASAAQRSATSTSRQPVRLQPARDAQPLRSSDRRQAASRADLPRNQLRWRQSPASGTPVASSGTGTASRTHRQVAYYGGSGDEQLRYRRPQTPNPRAVDGQPLQPIDDPFGDRRRAPATPTPAAAPTPAAGWQSAGSSPAATDPAPVMTNRSEPTPMELSPAAELNGPRPGQTTPAFSTSAGSPATHGGPGSSRAIRSTRPAGSYSAGSYSADTYSAGSRISEVAPVSFQSEDVTPPEQARETLLQVPVDEINLNVTPWYDAEARNYQGELSQRKSFRQNQSSRTWMSADGSALAEGRLVALENRQITILTNAGVQQRFWIDQLSDEDRRFAYAAWEIPQDVALRAEPLPLRTAIPQTVTWKASALCHKPLYFEDIQLERYGHSAGPILQPLKSTAHFFGNIAIFPYNTGIHPLNECQYSLGYYRPGDCAPWLIDPVPLSLRGAIRQATVVTAGALTIP